MKYPYQGRWGYFYCGECGACLGDREKLSDPEPVCVTCQEKEKSDPDFFRVDENDSEDKSGDNQ